MVEATRNIQRRRTQDPALEPREHRDDNQPITVYSNQRIRGRSQVHRGVSEFLTSLGAYMGERAKENVIAQAEQDFLEGEDSPELQDNWLYQQEVNKHRGRAEGIKLASNAQAQLERAYAEAEEAGDEFDLEAYVDQQFDILDDEKKASNPDFRRSLLDVREGLKQELSGAVAQLDARRQLKEANDTFLDIVHTTLDNVGTHDASLSETRDMLVRVGDELGLLNKDIRGAISSAYLTKMSNSENLDEVKKVEEDLRGWLRSTDRGLLRRIDDDIQAVRQDAETRIERAEAEARAEQLQQVTDTYLGFELSLSENPGSVSLAQLSEARNAGMLGITDEQNENRYMALRRLKARGQEQQLGESQFRELQERAFNVVSDLIQGDDPMAVFELRTHLEEELGEDLGQFSESDIDSMVPDFLDQKFESMVRSPRGDAPSIMDTIRDYVQNPTPMGEQAISDAADDLAPIIDTARKFNHELDLLSELIGNHDPNDPRFRASAALVSSIQSSSNLYGLGISNEALSKYETYNKFVRYMQPEQAIAQMTDDDNLISSQASRQLVAQHVDTPNETRLRRALNNRRVRAGPEPANFQQVLMEVTNLAAEMVRYDQTEIGKTFDRAAEMVADRMNVIDGFAFPERDVSPEFAAVYSDRAGAETGGTLRDRIAATAEEAIGRPLPEGWVLRPAPGGGRSGLMFIVDPATNLPVMNPNDRTASTINPEATLSAFMEDFAEEERERLIEVMRDRNRPPRRSPLVGTAK